MRPILLFHQESDSIVHTLPQGPLEWSSEILLCRGPALHAWNPASPSSVLFPTVVWVTHTGAQGAPEGMLGRI